MIGEDGDHYLKWRQSTAQTLACGGDCSDFNNHANLGWGLSKPGSVDSAVFAPRSYSIPHSSKARVDTSWAAKASLQTSKIPCALPPLPCEQRAIATALSDVDALLGGLDRLIAKKRDLKQAAMQQLLTGQTRLPASTVSGEVNRIVEILL